MEMQDSSEREMQDSSESWDGQERGNSQGRVMEWGRAGGGGDGGDGGDGGGGDGDGDGGGGELGQ
jgi:hypothetical protein